MPRHRRVVDEIREAEVARTLLFEMEREIANLPSESAPPDVIGHLRGECLRMFAEMGVDGGAVRAELDAMLSGAHDRTRALKDLVLKHRLIRRLGAMDVVARDIADRTEFH